MAAQVPSSPYPYSQRRQTSVLGRFSNNTDTLIHPPSLHDSSPCQVHTVQVPPMLFTSLGKFNVANNVTLCCTAAWDFVVWDFAWNQDGFARQFPFYYAKEMFIMHFLEAARFLNAPVLAGRKVNVLYVPGLAVRLPPPPHYSCLGPETTTLFSFS